MERHRIIQAAQHFAGNADLSDRELVKCLCNERFTLEESERLVAFLPMAFARVVISHLAKVSFKTDYRIKETGKIASLMDEPIFVEASKLAIESYHSDLMARETFSAVAARSAEFNAVNTALNGGVDINGASFNTVEVFGYKTFGKAGWFNRIFG